MSTTKTDPTGCRLWQSLQGSQRHRERFYRAASYCLSQRYWSAIVPTFLRTLLLFPKKNWQECFIGSSKCALELGSGIGLNSVLARARRTTHKHQRPNSLKISGTLIRGRTESNALITSVRNFEEGIYAITIAKTHNWSRRGRGGHWLGRPAARVVKPKLLETVLAHGNLLFTR